ncbi:MAG TPA: hypothetical protein VIN04_00205 [Myxococcota bacterium]
MSHDGVQDGRRAGAASSARALGGYRCDFCGALAPVVRRVALDRDYDRLQTPHRELYACDPCSHRKEQRRLGLES